MTKTTSGTPRPDEEAVMQARERIAGARRRQLDNRLAADARRDREYDQANQRFVKAVRAEQKRRVSMTDIASAADMARQEIYRLIKEHG